MGSRGRRDVGGLHEVEDRPVDRQARLESVPELAPRVVIGSRDGPLAHAVTQVRGNSHHKGHGQVQVIDPRQERCLRLVRKKEAHRHVRMRPLRGHQAAAHSTLWPPAARGNQGPRQ